MRSAVLLPLPIVSLLCACAPTASAPLAPHQPARVLGATPQATVDADVVVDLLLGLELRDAARLRTLMARPGGFGVAIAPADFAERFGPTAGDYARVVDWARAQSLEVVRTAASRSTLTVRGRAADVARAFGTKLLVYSDARGRFRAPDGTLAALAPGGALHGLVATVVGLDDATRYTPRRRAPRFAKPTPQPVPHAGQVSQEPKDLRRRYGIEKPTALNPNPVCGDPELPYCGEGETVAILGTGDPPSPTNDVNRFARQFLLPTNVPAQYTQIFLGGANRDPVDFSAGEYFENVLDVDMAMGLAPLASVVHVHTATNAPGLFSDGIAFIIDNVPQAHAASVSFGLCEKVSTYETTLLESLFTQALSQGQTWFFASGDNGTDDCGDGRGNQVLTVEWPASAPHAIGVGGTALNGPNEIGWFGSGGGLSELFARPDYQVGVGPVPTVDARMVPDVAALAGDPGVTTVEFGQVSPGGQGTSAATPMWAAMWTLLHQKLGSSGITNTHERLYALGAANATTPVFTDMTSGNNAGPGTQGYNAVAGFDLVTGWGSPLVDKLMANW